NEATSTLLPRPPADTAKHSTVESASQWASGHRALGRVGLVGRHAIYMEDARRPGGSRDQPFAESQPLLGLGHRRPLYHLRTNRRFVAQLLSVLRLLSVVSFPWPSLAAAHALGLGIK